MRLNAGFSWLHFLAALPLTALFILGTWLLVRAVSEKAQQQRHGSLLYSVVGFGLKFPAIIFSFAVIKSKNAPAQTGAIAGIVLVYLSCVAGAAFFTARNSK
jgi:Ca2+/Na+ antiporter